MFEYFFNDNYFDIMCIECRYNGDKVGIVTFKYLANDDVLLEVIRVDSKYRRIDEDIAIKLLTLVFKVTNVNKIELTDITRSGKSFFNRCVDIGLINIHNNSISLINNIIIAPDYKIVN